MSFVQGLFLVLTAQRKSENPVNKKTLIASLENSFYLDRWRYLLRSDARTNKKIEMSKINRSIKWYFKNLFWVELLGLIAITLFTLLK